MKTPYIQYVEDRNKLVHSQPNPAEEEFEVFLYVRYFILNNSNNILLDLWQVGNHYFQVSNYSYFCVH